MSWRRAMGVLAILSAVATGVVSRAHAQGLASQAMPGAPTATEDRDQAAPGKAGENDTAQGQPDAGMMANMENMDRMATTVTRAAEMCQMMMQGEMATRPYVLALGGTVAALLFIALVLLVVLEVLWIRYWRRKLST